MDADFIQEPSELHNQYNQDRVLRSYVQRQLPESVRSVVRPEHGAHSRVHQMLLASLFVPSTDMYGCPLAMTDGAARAARGRPRVPDRRGGAPPHEPRPGDVLDVGPVDHGAVGPLGRGA
jgi:hypothetical protein